MRLRVLVSAAAAVAAFVLAVGSPLWALASGGGSGSFADIASWANILALSVGSLAALDAYRTNRASDAESQLIEDVMEELGPEWSLLLGLNKRQSVLRADIPFRRSRYGLEEPSGSPSFALRGVDDAGTSPLSAVFTYFETGAGRRMVILGESGTGKTALALELIWSMLTNRDQSRDPIPVRFALVSWSPDTRSFFDWLCHELHVRYGISRKAAQKLIRNRRILAFLDGLDELDPTDSDLTTASLAAIKLNEYVNDHPRFRFVLTCRTSCYQRLPERVTLDGEVTVQPLTLEQIIAFVDQADLNLVQRQQKWEPIKAALESERGAAITEALCTPWRMTLAVTHIRAGGDTSAILKQDGEDQQRYLDRVAALLLGSFVAARARLAPQPRFTPEQSEMWARYMARYLDEQEVMGGPRSELLPHFAAQWVKAQHLASRYWPLVIGGTTFALLILLLGGAVGTTLSWAGRPGVLHLVRASLRAVAYPPPIGVAAGIAALLVSIVVPVARVPGASRQVRVALRRSGQGRPEVARRSGFLLFAMVLTLLSSAVTGVVAGALGGLPVWWISGRDVAVRVTAGIAVVMGSVAFVAMMAQQVSDIHLSFFQLDYWRRYELRDDEQSGLWLFEAPEMVNTMRPDTGGRPDAQATTKNWARAADDFMAWACPVGIVKRSGLGYQFRHRELEDWYLGLLERETVRDAVATQPTRADSAVGLDHAPLIWTRELRLSTKVADARWSRWLRRVGVFTDESILIFRAVHGRRYRDTARRVDPVARAHTIAAQEDARAALLFTAAARDAIGRARSLTLRQQRSEVGAADLLAALRSLDGPLPEPERGVRRPVRRVRFDRELRRDLRRMAGQASTAVPVDALGLLRLTGRAAPDGQDPLADRLRRAEALAVLRLAEAADPDAGDRAAGVGEAPGRVVTRWSQVRVHRHGTDDFAVRRSGVTETLTHQNLVRTRETDDPVLLAGDPAAAARLGLLNRGGDVEQAGTDFAALINDPERLADQLILGSDGEALSGADLLETAARFLMAGGVPPLLRGVAFAAIAELPELTYLYRRVLLSGRPATIIGVEDIAAAVTVELIIDDGAGGLLGWRRRLSRDDRGVAAGTVLESQQRPAAFALRPVAAKGRDWVAGRRQRRAARAATDRAVEQMGRLTEVTFRLLDGDRIDEALTVSRQAVALARDLVDSDRRRHLPGLASATFNRAVVLGRAGRYTEAVPVGVDAVTLYQELTGIDRKTYLPRLADALTNNAVWLSKAGRSTEAIRAGEEAVRLLRELSAEGTGRQP